MLLAEIQLSQEVQQQYTVLQLLIILLDQPQLHLRQVKLLVQCLIPVQQQPLRIQQHLQLQETQQQPLQLQEVQQQRLTQVDQQLLLIQQHLLQAEILLLHSQHHEVRQLHLLQVETRLQRLTRLEIQLPRSIQVDQLQLRSIQVKQLRQLIQQVLLHLEQQHSERPMQLAQRLTLLEQQLIQQVLTLRLILLQHTEQVWAQVEVQRQLMQQQQLTKLVNQQQRYSRLQLH